MKKIFVLTYDAIHRKTFDILSLLKGRGYDNVELLLVDHHYVKKNHPLLQHRPSPSNEISNRHLAENLRYTYHKFQRINDIDRVLITSPDSPILIGGAGIIPEGLIKKHTFINSHPGMLPVVRGLDSLKWAIHKNLPIGVTSHIISAEPDAGVLIEQVELSLQRYDTFHSIAYRQYEAEILLLVNAIEKYRNAKQAIVVGNNPLHKRMPKDLECSLYGTLNKRLNNL